MDSGDGGPQLLPTTVKTVRPVHVQAAFSGLEKAVAGEQSAPGPRTEKTEQRKALYGAAQAAHAVPGHDLHQGS